MEVEGILLLNPTDMPSIEEAEAGDSEVDSFITQAEVTEVAQKLRDGKAPGVDEIHTEYLESMDIVGLSLQAHLCSIVWQLGTVPLESLVPRRAGEVSREREVWMSLLKQLPPRASPG